MAKAEKSWEKRLSGSVDELAVHFVESLSFDRRLYKVDIVGSIAHAEMLAAQKLITNAELAEVKRGLIEIGEEIAAGTFAFDVTQEDIHMAVESALIAKTGDAGRKLHTAAAATIRWRRTSGCGCGMRSRSCRRISRFCSGHWSSWRRSTPTP